MTNRLETALEQVGVVFIEMAQEIRDLKAEIADLQVLVHKHETTNQNLSKVFNNFYNQNGPSQGGIISDDTSSI